MGNVLPADCGTEFLSLSGYILGGNEQGATEKYYKEKSHPHVEQLPPEHVLQAEPAEETNFSPLFIPKAESFFLTLVLSHFEH